MSFVEEYNPATDTWTTKTSPPCFISGPASFVFNNKIYAIGTDFDNSHGLWPGTFFEIYDPANDSWSIGASTPIGGLSVTACATTGTNAPERIYFFDLTQTKIYDPASGNWTEGAIMSMARLLTKAANVNDMIYVIGGRSGTIGAVTIVNPASTNEQYVPFGYKTDVTPPKITMLSPENKTYYGTDVSLNFTVDEPVSWMRYSLDGQDNVTITGNTTISELPNGAYNITVYATDHFGNTAAADTVHFNVNVPELFSTAPVAVGAVALTVVGVGLLVYFKKRRR